jgi:hypothetical protein
MKCDISFRDGHECLLNWMRSRILIVFQRRRSIFSIVFFIYLFILVFYSKRNRNMGERMTSEREIVCGGAII